MPEVKVEIAECMHPLFQRSRYKVPYGGRGGVKSWSIGRTLLLYGAQPSLFNYDFASLRVLCARETQASLADSVHQLLRDQISMMRLEGHYNITDQFISSVKGSAFTFAGIRQNVNKIKSMEGIDICWVEEAEKISKNSLKVLVPTIRKPGSELWFSFNPDLPTDPIVEHFDLSTPGHPGAPPDSLIWKVSWRDNPWFAGSPLEADKDWAFRTDPESARHVWDGEFRTKSKASIFGDKYTSYAFEADDPIKNKATKWLGPYFGADWGFAQDPAVLIRCWIYDRKLWIDYEFFGVGVENDELARCFKTVPGADMYQIWADSARPETISHVKNKGGMRIDAAEKWQGSIEDGIQFLRSFDQIVIHPRCRHMLTEAKLYSYKTDKITEEVLPIILDKNNHGWDAVRYALQKIIRNAGLATWEKLGRA